MCAVVYATRGRGRCLPCLPLNLSESLPSPTISSTIELSADEKRVRLFNVGDSFEISMTEFDVSNVWTEKSGYNGDSWKIFTCRFAKRTTSSTRKEGVPADKRRKTKCRPADLCRSTIKIYRFYYGTVRVEQYQASPDHSHSLRESDQIKRPQVIRALVETEAVKNYPPPASSRPSKNTLLINSGLPKPCTL